jgi:hypothetical protein
MDMKNFAGTGTGGMKLESWSETGKISETADMPATGQSSSWATYSWSYTINPAATRIKFVPLATGNSGSTNADIIGFDNIRVENTPVGPPPVVVGIPNPGFEIPGGANWSFVSDGPSVNYLAPGGNPNGYAVITQPQGVGNFGVLIANSNAALTIGPGGQLPLTAGTTATFAMDMRLEAGSAQSNIGGFKVEFPGVPFPNDSTGDMYPAKSGSGTEWATYTFSVPIPAGATSVKLVPLWGPNSKVGYDNIRIVNTFAAAIANGTNVSWTANPDYTYQPQSSATSASGPWVNIGSPISGGAGSTIYQAVNAPFYQVLETTPVIYDNVVFNPGFEIAGPTEPLPAFGADGWGVTGGVPPGNSISVSSNYGSGTVFPYSGSAMLAIDATAPAVNAEVRSEKFTVEPNKTYTFSFYLSIPLKNGGSSFQTSLFYFEDLNPVPISNVFTAITTAGIGSGWTKVTQTITTPALAVEATVGFLLANGADAGIHWVTLIDNVSIDTGLIVPPLTTTTAIAATTAPAVEVSWPTARVPNGKPNRIYQVSSSPDLVNWGTFGGPVTGNGSAFSVTDGLTPTSKFFRVSEVTP